MRATTIAAAVAVAALAAASPAVAVDNGAATRVCALCDVRTLAGCTPPGPAAKT